MSIGKHEPETHTLIPNSNKNSQEPLEPNQCYTQDQSPHHDHTNVTTNRSRLKLVYQEPVTPSYHQAQNAKNHLSYLIFFGTWEQSISVFVFFFRVLCVRQNMYNSVGIKITSGEIQGEIVPSLREGLGDSFYTFQIQSILQDLFVYTINYIWPI